MDDELTQALEKISRVTGMPVDELINLAVLEFVQSFDLDFAGARNAVLQQSVEVE